MKDQLSFTVHTPWIWTLSCWRNRTSPTWGCVHAFLVAFLSCTARQDRGSVGFGHGERQRKILSFSVFLPSWRKNVILFWSGAIRPWKGTCVLPPAVLGLTLTSKFHILYSLFQKVNLALCWATNLQVNCVRCLSPSVCGETVWRRL